MLVGRFHLIFDLVEVSQDLLTSKKGVKNLIENLASQIEMKILYGPVVIVGTKDNPGLTGFAIVDFSHISVHTFTQSAKVYIDIFSCKVFNQNSTKDQVLKYFQIAQGQLKMQQICWR